ncbi:MAG: glycosyltransferase family 4 protein [Candidatus Paceibacterota bacterium]|jgi:glycosyltransferase involved in cell wall biosynthesis
MKPAIMGVGNAIWTGSGYGRQLFLLLTALKKRGYKVANLAWHGLHGTTLEYQGIPMYPGFAAGFGTDVIAGDAKHFGADLVLSLQDIWVLPNDYRDKCGGLPWMPMFPIDTTPVAERNVEVAAASDYPVVYSRFGLQEMANSGLPCTYIPHMVDMNVYKPGDKAEARKKLRIPKDAFVVSMVAANQGYPSRKAFPENIRAFKMFLDTHPEAFLRLHTQINPPEGEGIIFSDLLSSLDIPHDRVSFCDQLMNANGLPDWYVALTYQASDVVLNASRAEGFGLAIVEAQACGVPVITTNCTSMTELTVNGICTEPLQPEWYSMGGFGAGSWHFIPSVERISKALETIHDWSEKERTQNSERGVLFIKDNFECELVADKYWVPFLDKVGDEIESGVTERKWLERKAHIEAAYVLKDRLKELKDFTPKPYKQREKPPETPKEPAK